MRRAFVHEASLELELGGDDRAPGAAVTAALCGHWEHSGPCRWPHRNEVVGRGQTLLLRVLFVADPSEEQGVRARIDGAVRAGILDGPTGTSRWTALGSGPSALRDDEEAVAAELTRR